MSFLKSKTKWIIDKDVVKVGEPVEVNGSHYLITDVTDNDVTLISHTGDKTQVTVDQIDSGKVNIKKMAALDKVPNKKGETPGVADPV